MTETTTHPYQAGTDAILKLTALAKREDDQVGADEALVRASHASNVPNLVACYTEDGEQVQFGGRMTPVDAIVLSASALVGSLIEAGLDSLAQEIAVQVFEAVDGVINDPFMALIQALQDGLGGDVIGIEYAVDADSEVIDEIIDVELPFSDSDEV